MYVRTYICSCNTYIHNITSRPFPFGVSRDHFLPLATILTNTFRFFHCHQIPHTRSPVSGTPDLALLQNFPNLVKKSSPRSSPSSSTAHIRLINLFCQSPFIHPFYMTKPSQHIFLNFSHYIFFQTTFFSYHRCNTLLAVIRSKNI
jgi:hypothetical protein